MIILAGICVRSLKYDTFSDSETAVETIKRIPLDIKEWHGEDVVLDEQVYSILETRAIIHRNYSNNGHNVFLSIVYYPETKVDFHAPEACLGGQGQKTKKQFKKISINYNGKIKIGLNELLQTNNDNTTLVYYFYKAGDFVGESYIKLRFSLTLNKFFNNKKSGALIRISTPIVNGNSDAASEEIVRFIEELYPYIIKNL